MARGRKKQPTLLDLRHQFLETVEAAQRALTLGAFNVAHGLERAQKVLDAATVAQSPKTHVDVMSRLLVKFAVNNGVDAAFVKECIDRAFLKHRQGT